MQDDDEPRGRVLTRREVLALLGAGGAMILGRPSAALAPLLARATAGPSAGIVRATACIVRPQQTEGPYFVDELLDRSDIRTDPSDGSVRPGAQLRLSFDVSGLLATSGCVPLAGAVVDVWHCDALGVYSDVQDPSFDTRGKKYLRGYQVTDANGVATFTTIYPGWYGGRTVHVHFKIRSAPTANPGWEFTSQLYFDDTLTDTVHAQQPYAAKGQRTLRNAGDGIYGQGGSQLLLAAVPDAQGYAATFDVSLQGVVGVEPHSWTGVKAKYT